MINISAEDAKLFQDNGFTKEQIGATINHYRQQGLSDNDIQLKIKDKLSSLGNNPIEQKSGIGTPYDWANNLRFAQEAALTAPIKAIKDKKSLKQAYLDKYNQRQEQLEQFKQEHPLLSGASRLASDTLAYSAFAPIKVARDASALAKAGNFLGNAAIQGGLPGLIEGADQGEALKGAGAGTGLALGVQAALSGVPKFGKYTTQLLNNPTFQKGLSKVEELLTSVPSEMSERALQKELAGDSIFRGKFNSKDLNEAYNLAGQKAIAGMKNAEYLANQQIGDALNSLPANSINAPMLITNITKDIDQLSRGGRINPALAEKGDDILNVLNELGNKGNKTVDFHHIKDNLQTKLRNQYGKESGTGINALKGMGAKIREALNEASPDYAHANANREALYDIKDSLGGMNKKTIASNLRNVEGDAKVRAGYSQAAEELENLVAPEYKFLDEVKDLRAREALESWYPGQYGGFGSSHGAANLLRGVVGGSISGLTHNPLLLAAFSPKIGAKGTIQNLGRLNNMAQGWRSLVPGNIRDLLTPIMMQGIYNE